MRFALVGPSAPIRGGIAIGNDALASALVSAAHEVSQFSFRRLYPASLFPGKSQYDATTTFAPSQARHCIDSLNPWTWLRAARLIALQHPHVATFQWWHPFFAPCYATILARLKRLRPTVPRLLISHTVRPHEAFPGQDFAARFVARLCSGVIVHSQSEHDLMRAIAPDAPVRIIDYPLLHTTRSLPPREEAQRRLGVSGRVLLFFGYVRKYKGVDVLLRALAQVPQPSQVSLLIAGEFYEPVDAYRSLIEELGISRRVQIVNRYIGEPEWPDLFAASDALVLPYRSASQSMSIALAYGFGKPVIVSRVGGLTEAVEDGRTGLIADPEPAALAVAIQRLYAELLPCPYQEYIAARRRRLGWEPFLHLLENWRAPD
jgi:glycosyltransferase involved in cell wall biosynthesis